MCMHVCVRMCVYVRMHVCVHVCVCACVCVHGGLSQLCFKNCLLSSQAVLQNQAYLCIMFRNSNYVHY